MKYNFKKLERNTYHGISVKKNSRGICVSNSVDKLIDFEKVKIEIDEKNLAIKFTPVAEKENGHKISRRKNSSLQIGASTYKKIPSGRYLLVDEKNLIFIKEK